jgi:hypothetical protein
MGSQLPGSISIVNATLTRAPEATLADLATAVLAWARLTKRGFFRNAARPSGELARRIAGYRLRAQVGAF